MEDVDERQNCELREGYLSHGKDLMAKEQKRQNEEASFLQTLLTGEQKNCRQAVRSKVFFPSLFIKDRSI